MTDIRARCMDMDKKKSKMFSGFLDRWHEIIISFMSKQSLYSVFVLPEAIFKKKKMRHLAWLYVPLRNWNKDDFNNLKKDMLYVPSIHIFFFLRYVYKASQTFWGRSIGRLLRGHKSFVGFKDWLIKCIGYDIEIPYRGEKNILRCVNVRKY